MTGSRPPAIGLVLGGGGMAGYAFHCGVLAAIVEQTGFDPRTAEIVIGTSAGSIAGAVIRGDVPAEAMRQRLAASADDPAELATLKLLAGRSPKAIPRLWAGPGSPALAVRQLRRGRNLRLTKLAAGLLPQGRLDLSPIRGQLDELHRRGWPQRDLWIPATALRTGHRVVFGRDVIPSVADAVAASAALPGFFAPVSVEGRSFIDGGIASPFNADLLADHRTADGRPLDLVIILAPLSLDELARATPIASVTRSLPRRRLVSEVASIEDHGTRTLIFQPDAEVARAMGVNPMDHNRIGSILDRSAGLVERSLPDADPYAVEQLTRAAATLTSPADVPYPLAERT